MADLIAAKAALRAVMRARRKDLARHGGAAAAQALALWVEHLPRTVAPGLVVSGYLATGAEIDPAVLLQRLAELGARIALPVVTAPDAPLIFREAVGAMTPDAAGMAAPVPEAPSLRPDLLLVPLVAFDDFGGRLGQGGGYYDRTLTALRAEGPVTAAGVAFAGQRVERLELSAHDQRLDGVLTEEGYRAAFGS